MKFLMQTMGVSSSMDEFFSSTTKFISLTTEKPETDKETYFRQEIWVWLENSLSKGSYKWVTRTITPTYDIHALYTKIVSLANKATFISHALEFKKIFSIPISSDIFQYHSDILQQMKVVKSQGESLGLDATIVDRSVAESAVPKDRTRLHYEGARSSYRSAGEGAAKTTTPDLTSKSIWRKGPWWPATGPGRSNSRGGRPAKTASVFSVSEEGHLFEGVLLLVFS